MKPGLFCKLAGITYRQLSHWRTRGLLGDRLDVPELVVAKTIKALKDRNMSLQIIHCSFLREVVDRVRRLGGSPWLLTDGVLLWELLYQDSDQPLKTCYVSKGAVYALPIGAWVEDARKGDTQ